MNARALLLFLLCSAAPLAGQTTVPAALETAKKDLESALSSLSRTRNAITAEKPGLAGEFGKVELELGEKRRLVRIARMSREDREQAMRELERDRATRRQDAAYLAGLLKDHALKTETLSSPGEPALELDPKVIAAEASQPGEALTARLAVVDASLDRLGALFGGSVGGGKAAAPDGDIVSGRFAAAGPLVWFAASDGKTAGAVVSGLKGGVPELAANGDDSVHRLVAGEESVVGIDVTGGKARALEEVQGGFVDLVRKGGLWVWPIMGLALLSLVFGIIKLSSFIRLREPGEAWIAAILAALRVGDQSKAEAIARDANHPAGPVLERLVQASARPADVVEETLYEQLMGVQQKAGSMLPVIAVTAATSPLLGLLGTVSGMISTFNLITIFGSGDPKPLAGGISEALITTLFGLVVAIPALILHAFLNRRSQGIVQTTERLGLSFVNALRGK